MQLREQFVFLITPQIIYFKRIYSAQGFVAGGRHGIIATWAECDALPCAGGAGGDWWCGNQIKFRIKCVSALPLKNAINHCQIGSPDMFVIAMLIDSLIRVCPVRMWTRVGGRPGQVPRSSTGFAAATQMKQRDGKEKETKRRKWINLEKLISPAKTLRTCFLGITMVALL